MVEAKYLPTYGVINPLSIAKPSEVDYPFFVKPIKGTMSIRAQTVHNDDQLKNVCRLSYRDVSRCLIFYRPLNQFLSIYQLNHVAAYKFIGESLLNGTQVTVEGFIQNQVVTVIGIVDSIFYSGTISFQRFEYPSKALTASTQRKMIELVQGLMSKSI